MKALVGLILLCILCPTLHSQTSSPGTPVHIPIYFECQCDDDSAARFASAFRDIIATSPRYTMAGAAQEQLPGEKYQTPHWHLKVLSLDTTQDNSGAGTALSEVLLIGDNLYITQSIQLCGRNKAVECAQSAFAMLDKHVHDQ